MATSEYDNKVVFLLLKMSSLIMSIRFQYPVMRYELQYTPTITNLNGSQWPQSYNDII